MHVFLRHPPLPQLEGVCYGRLDTALPEQVFADAARALAPVLPPYPIISSPSQRCLGLARAIGETRAAGGSGADAVRTDALHTDIRLLELDFGQWEGQRWDALPRESMDAWSQDLAGFAAPGGESFGLLIRRVAAALSELATPHLIVTHAGVIRAALHVAGMPLVQAASATIPYLTLVRAGDGAGMHAWRPSADLPDPVVIRAAKSSDTSRRE